MFVGEIKKSDDGASFACCQDVALGNLMSL